MISVIIPTYQSPEMLDLCLQSAVEGQTNKNQIIVVVDGFYELNKTVLDKWDKHVDLLIMEENVGLCRGTNLGVSNAEHEKILIVNDDNVFPLNWDSSLEKIYQEGWVFSPNQIEPHPSMFKQFHIKDLGTSPENFSLSKFQEYENEISEDRTEFEGSTLPIFMSKLDYLKIGGWDENYELGMVADWDFFLKCDLNGFNLMRTYDCNFYHFASASTNGEKRRNAEKSGHYYAKYKWGTNIKHNPKNNLKYL